MASDVKTLCLCCCQAEEGPASESPTVVLGAAAAASDGAGAGEGRPACPHCGRPIGGAAACSRVSHRMAGSATAPAEKAHPSDLLSVEARGHDGYCPWEMPAGGATSGVIDGEAEKTAAAPPVPTAGTTWSIPGYAIEAVIGHGGMGTVYRARQLSLGRSVAIKVLHSRWLNDPAFVSRFIREAYAAAQLSHPNIVQIYDIGVVEGVPYFTMEYVRGHSLGELLKRRGRWDPEMAARYILQAARGLQHAHERGMIHRDIKPDNLLLDEHGLIKVTDLGLVKTPQPPQEIAASMHARLAATAAHPPRGMPGTSAVAEGNGSHVTGTAMALGTPAYMAPEQCQDASAVDHRADIYALGCTFYALLTGSPPFEADDPHELMSKHLYEPLTPPHHRVSRIPPQLSAIVQRMLAKHPEDRYPHMAAVVRALEEWLGIHPDGGWTPSEEQIDRLRAYARQFHRVPVARLRRRVLVSAMSLWLLGAVLIPFFAHPRWLFGWITLLVVTAVARFVWHGLTDPGPLFIRVRRFVFGMSAGDWLLVVAAVAVGIAVLAICQILQLWLGFALVGIGLAGMLHYGCDRPVRQQRSRTVEACEQMFRFWRNQGIAEPQLRLLVARYGGRHWEELFEHLFGYDAKLAVRAQLAGRGQNSEKHAAWREPLIAWLDQIESRRQLHREQRLFEMLERARLLADGASDTLATAAARRSAAALVELAQRVRRRECPDRLTAWLAADGSPLGSPLDRRCGSSRFDSSLLSIDPASPYASHAAGWLLDWWEVPLRCLLAATLLAGGMLWIYQNYWLAEGAAPPGEWPHRLMTLWQKPTQPLTIRGLPEAATAWINGWHVLAAGLLVLLSLLYRGAAMSALVLLGAAVIVVGPHYGIRTAEPLHPEHVALILGTSLTLVGLRCGR